MRKRALKQGEIEIHWAQGNLELIQTNGLHYQTGALVLTVNGHLLVIPFTSIRSFRIAVEPVEVAEFVRRRA